MAALSIAALLVGVLLLTSCGSLMPSQKKILQVTAQTYGQVYQGDTRAAATARLGLPQHSERRQDRWEHVVDEANYESLVLRYDRNDVIIDGGRSAFRGDRRGLFHWGKEVSYYLPQRSPNPSPEALRSRSRRGELRL